MMTIILSAMTPPTDPSASATRAGSQASAATLANQSVVVAGGAGEVGEGIVAALLARGASVLVPSRSAGKLAALRSAVGDAGAGRLETLETDLGTEAGRARLRAAAEAAGPLRAVVASLGGFWQGPPVVEVPPAAFREGLEQRLFPHLHLAQTLLPLLHGPATSLVQINGLAAVLAIPGLSALGVSTAAQLALTRSLIAEATADSPRIVGLLIEEWVRSRSRQELPADALTAREVGEEVVRLILTPGPHALLTLGKPGGQIAVRPLSAAAGALSADKVLAALEQ